jgi:hypothetical protein
VRVAGGCEGVGWGPEPDVLAFIVDSHLSFPLPEGAP